MSSRELIESLRTSGADKISQLRREAEQQATALDQAAENKLRELRETCAAKIAALTGEADRQAAATAGIEARRIRLVADQETAHRLYACARQLLPQLRNVAYPAVFTRLVAELSTGSWASVQVNPADVALAKQTFPDAEIVPTETISGGLDAASGDGAIRVVNSFEKRLERAWNDLLPSLIRELEREATHGTAPAA